MLPQLYATVGILLFMVIAFCIVLWGVYRWGKRAEHARTLERLQEISKQTWEEVEKDRQRPRNDDILGRVQDNLSSDSPARDTSTPVEGRKDGK